MVLAVMLGSSAVISAFVEMARYHAPDFKGT